MLAAKRIFCIPYFSKTKPKSVTMFYNQITVRMQQFRQIRAKLKNNLKFDIGRLCSQPFNCNVTGVLPSVYLLLNFSNIPSLKFSLMKCLHGPLTDTSRGWLNAVVFAGTTTSAMLCFSSRARTLLLFCPSVNLEVSYLSLLYLCTV